MELLKTIKNIFLILAILIIVTLLLLLSIAISYLIVRFVVFIPAEILLNIPSNTLDLIAILSSILLGIAVMIVATE
jgi:hypothetical protein